MLNELISIKLMRLVPGIGRVIKIIAKFKMTLRWHEVFVAQTRRGRAHTSEHAVKVMTQEKSWQ